MLLPREFVFSQQNLQDYSDCQRRFYLRYLLKLEWPAVESEPIREQEELITLGTRFHLLCQQFFTGIPVQFLTDQIDHPELAIWWQNFLDLNLLSHPGDKYPEKMLSIPFLGYRLVAKFDLIHILPDKSVSIYDWKTSKNPPNRKALSKRLQSKIYPYVLLKVAQYAPPFVDHLEMKYWYPAYPSSSVTYIYSDEQKGNDQELLSMLITEIANKNDQEEFDLTDDIKKCGFCKYRSFCERGNKAGYDENQNLEIDSDSTFDIDFESL